MPVLRCFFPFSADSSPSGGPKKNFRRDCQCALLWPRHRRKSRRGGKKEKNGFRSGLSKLQVDQHPVSRFDIPKCQMLLMSQGIHLSKIVFYICFLFFRWNTTNTSYIMLGHGFFQPLTPGDCLRSAPRGSFCVFVWRVQPWSLQEQWRTMGADTGSHLCTFFFSTKLATLCGKNIFLFF